MRNVSVAAREWKGEVVFLRKLVRAARAARSASRWPSSLACRATVVARARAILETLEADGGRRGGGSPRPVAPADSEPAAAAGAVRGGGTPPPPELAAAMIERIRAIDPDELTPRAAYDLVAELVKKLTTST